MTLRAAFEFFTKLGVGFWCFHDRDIAPEADNLAETNKRLDKIVDHGQEAADATPASSCSGARPTCSRNRRFMAGAVDQPLARRLRLRRQPGEEGDGGHQANSAARATSSGAAARATRRCSTPT